MGNGNGVVKPPNPEVPPMHRLFSKENLLVLMLTVMILLIIIATTDATPQWIYQGF